MKKQLLIFSIFFSPIISQACPTPLQNMEVDIIASPLLFDYSLTSKQMQQMKEKEEGTQQYTNSDAKLLGLYLSKRQFQISPLAESTKSFIDSKFCSSVTKLKFIIKLDPVIYVSREAQTFACTKQRVEQHEMVHHKYEIEANTYGKQKIYDIINKYYARQFYSIDRADLGRQLEEKNQLAFNEIYSYFNQLTQNKHNAIDTPENYKEETKLCPNNENNYVMQLIKQGHY